jgi:hypothetical protein
MRRSHHLTRPPRIDLRRPAILINSDGVEADVVILDISSGGFRFESEESLRIGEQVTLRAERGTEFQCQIMWVLGREAGGAFLDRVQLSNFS